jgi:hypothetical protein
MPDVDSANAGDKYLCFNCIGDVFLSHEVSRLGTNKKCSYCGEIHKAYSLVELSEKIEEAFEQHYTRTSDEPPAYLSAVLADKEMNYEWEREGEAVVYAIMNAAEIQVEAAADIRSILEEKFFDFETAKMAEEMEFSSDSYYEERGADDAQWQEEWRAFERSLKTEARFFSRTALDLLHTIFDGIEEMRAADGRSMVVDAGPETAFPSVFRARVFQSREDLKAALAKPDILLGSPPSKYARAGRMNAHGISVFYGANDPMVALAEVRPPVGSKVAIARFDIVRPIRLLDLTALKAVTSYGSIFDPELAGRLERAVFLRSLSQKITRPVMPNDETFEYLGTQAIADFLAVEKTQPIDGIIFPSVQANDGALNVVLFHKAARVEEIELPTGTQVNVWLGYGTEDGWEEDYTVSEKVPPQEESAETESHFDWSHFPGDFDISEEQQTNFYRPTLRIDQGSISVHAVEAVKFETRGNNVRRYRIDSK